MNFSLFLLDDRREYPDIFGWKTYVLVFKTYDSKKNKYPLIKPKAPP
jgi:hypothetical protein